MTAKAYIQHFDIEQPLGDSTRIVLDDDHAIKLRQEREPVVVNISLMVTGDYTSHAELFLEVIRVLQEMYREKYRPDITGMEPQIGGKK